MPADTPMVLLVEDDAVLATFLADNLSADGYEPIVADTVRDGLRDLEYKQPDVAIVDLRLPDASGIELIDRVRAADGVASRLDPAIPLLVLSGHCGELDAPPLLRARGGRFRFQALFVPGAAASDRSGAQTHTRAGRTRPAAGGRAGARPVVPRGPPAWPSDPPLAEGVRTPQGVGRPADPGLDEGGAAPRCLGLPLARRDAHLGQPRLPTAPEARACRATPSS